MNQHLIVKIDQLIVAYRDVGEGREQERKLCNLVNRLTKAGSMSGAIALGLTCDWRLDLARSGVPDFYFTSE